MEVDTEVNMIKQQLELEDINASQFEKYKELFSVYKKIVFTGVTLQVLQQLCGINTAMYYGPEMMEQLGFGGDGDEISVIKYTQKNFDG